MEGTSSPVKRWVSKCGPLELSSALTCTLTTLGPLLLAPATMLGGGPSSRREAHGYFSLTRVTVRHERKADSRANPAGPPQPQHHDFLI